MSSFQHLRYARLPLRGRRGHHRRLQRRSGPQPRHHRRLSRRGADRCGGDAARRAGACRQTRHPGAELAGPGRPLPCHRPRARAALPCGDRRGLRAKRRCLRPPGRRAVRRGAHRPDRHDAGHGLRPGHSGRTSAVIPRRLAVAAASVGGRAGDPQDVAARDDRLYRSAQAAARGSSVRACSAPPSARCACPKDR